MTYQQVGNIIQAKWYGISTENNAMVHVESQMNSKLCVSNG